MKGEMTKKDYSYVGYEKLPASGFLVKFSNGTKKEDAYFQVSTDFLQESESLFKQNDAHKSILMILREYPLQLERIPSSYFLSHSNFYCDCYEVLDEYKNKIKSTIDQKFQDIKNICDRIK